MYPYSVSSILDHLYPYTSLDEVHIYLLRQVDHSSSIVMHAAAAVVVVVYLYLYRSYEHHHVYVIF